MKAIVYTAYGPPEVLHLAEIEKPTPKPNEILVKVRARPVSSGDLFARNFGAISPREFPMPAALWLPSRLEIGLRKPRKTVLGSEFAGEVEAVGSEVTTFDVGDAVFGYLGSNFGAYAEYICVKADGLVTAKPENLGYEEAAGVAYGAITAWNLLRKVDIAPGQNVLVNGASGGIGTYAVQLAKHHFGAEVTGVCSTPRVNLVKMLGADHVIDYTWVDFTEGDETYDLVFDTAGKSSFETVKRVLAPNGRYLLAAFKMKQVWQMLWTWLFGSQKVICALSIESRDVLEFVAGLAAAGTIQSVVDACYPLEQAAEAHRYIEDGHKKGHVILTS